MDSNKKYLNIDSKLGTAQPRSYNNLSAQIWHVQYTFYSRGVAVREYQKRERLRNLIIIITQYKFKTYWKAQHSIRAHLQIFSMSNVQHDQKWFKSHMHTTEESIEYVWWVWAGDDDNDNDNVWLGQSVDLICRLVGQLVNSIEDFRIDLYTHAHTQQ